MGKSKKRLFAALSCAAMLLSGCGAPTGGESGSAGTETQGSVARDGLRAVWVSSVYNLDYPSKGTADPAALKQEADSILKNAAELGMNAVFLQVRPSCDAFYPSELFPWSRYLTGDQSTAPKSKFDPLEYWVEQAHALGLELHAWLNPYRVTKGGQAEFDALSSKSPAKQHPEWVVEYEKNYYLNPGLPEVRELVVQGAEEIVRNYDVDGIHLDDYFYPETDFDDAATYETYGGGFSDPGDWRRDNVNKLVQELDTRLHAIKSGLSFGISPSGVWRDKKSDSRGSNTTGAYESYSRAYADSRRWVKEGWVDYICPQVYWEIGHKSMDYATIVRWWAETVRGTEVKLYIGMADYRTDEAKDASSAWYGGKAVREQLALNKTIPEVAGEAHFRYRFLVKNEDLRDIYLREYAGVTAGGSVGADAETLAWLAKLPAAEQTHWAAADYGKLGIVKGNENGSFTPDAPVTRATAAVMLRRAMGTI